MEITKCLTLSTAHISKNTANLLDKEIKTPYLNLPVYDKTGVGWFIYIPTNLNELDKLPSDLTKVLSLAKDLNCNMLCLDSDGDIISWLPKYDW